MFIFYYITKEDIKEHDPNWSKIPDHPYWITIIGGSGSGKANALLNLINSKPDIDKIYFYAKDLYQAKYQSLISKRVSPGLQGRRKLFVVVVRGKGKGLSKSVGHYGWLTTKKSKYKGFKISYL